MASIGWRSARQYRAQSAEAPECPLLTWTSMVRQGPFRPFWAGSP